MDSRIILAILIIVGWMFVSISDEQQDIVISPIMGRVAPESPLSEREMVERAINNTDKDIMAHIVFINVTTKNEVTEQCQNEKVVGCTITKTLTATSEDTRGTNTIRIDTARIYIANKAALKPTCNSFENTLYHEIGHVVYNYQHNFDVNESEIPAMEEFANAYADQFAKTRC